MHICTDSGQYVIPEALDTAEIEQGRSFDGGFRPFVFGKRQRDLPVLQVRREADDCPRPRWENHRREFHHRKARCVRDDP